MNKATVPLVLPPSIKRAAERLAKEDGISLDQWIAIAVAEKVGAVETASHFFERRAQGPSEDLGALLRTAPDRAPLPEDELPTDR